MRRLLPLGSVLLLGGAVLAACGGDSGSGGAESSLEQALRRMVLQAEDLPQGFDRQDELLTTNEHQASFSADPEARKSQLEGWGRLLGYEVTYHPSRGVADELPVQGLNVSASLYRNAEGAAEAFLTDAVKGAQERAWAADYPGLTDFQQEEVDVSDLADEIVWLRLSGFQPAATGPEALVTDDLIFFRVGRERGFLRVLASSTRTEDRQQLRSAVKGWLRTLVQNVEEALAEFGLEEEG